MPPTITKPALEKQCEQISTALLKISQLECRIKRNNLRRKLYTETELLIADIEEALSEEPDPPTREAYENCVSKLSTQRDQCLGLEGVRPASALEVAWSVVRLGAFVCWFTFFMTVILYLTPLRWIHPLLRRIGVPNNYLPVDFLQTFYCKGLLAVAGVQTETQNRDVLQQHNGPVILFFSHSSNWDAMILLSKSPIVAKMVGKLSLFLIPVLGWTARWTLGAFPIDRSNRQKAIKSLQRAKASVDRWGRSIGISPEGTRSKTGQIIAFKKGPFHLQEETGIPIAPVLIFGAFELWPRSRFFSATGKVKVRFLEPFMPKPGDTREQHIKDCRKRFLQAAANGLTDDISGDLDMFGMVFHVFSVIAVYGFAYSFVNLAIAAAFSLMTVMGWGWWQFFSFVMASVVFFSGLMFITQ